MDERIDAPLAGAFVKLVPVDVLREVTSRLTNVAKRPKTADELMFADVQAKMQDQYPPGIESVSEHPRRWSGERDPIPH